MRIRLEPDDDLLHPSDDDPNFNESRYYNFFDLDAGLGGFVRMGNRPNEGYAELTVCLYLPDGSVGFLFRRPTIEGHTAHDAGGLRFEVLAPFERHRVTYDGRVCVLARPRDMVDPKAALTANPYERCAIDLELAAIGPVWGGEPVWEEGEEPPPGTLRNFARGHTEQHMGVAGTVTVGDRHVELSDGLSFRDHSWGPRVWQSIPWYRWVNVSFGPLGIGATLRGDEHGNRHVNGFVYDVERYGDNRGVPIRDLALRFDYDDEGYPRSAVAAVTTDDHAYEMEGEMRATIPLRNRRDGRVTRITENHTVWRLGELTGVGLSENLDQVVDGAPVGLAAGI